MGIKLITYKDAGVDITQADNALDRIKQHVAKTKTKHVVTQLGGFGSGFSLKEICAQYQSPILVQSMDGVGTKTIVARMANDFSTLGHDLLSACANDILVMGAKPLTLLDYLASENLNPDIIESIITGLSNACSDNGTALVGGEMAQMPDTYLKNEWDIVGIVTGVVDQTQMITGEKIQAGDVVIGLLSNGLHTNGYSLARKLLFDIGGYHINTHINSLKTTLAKALLAPHINYTKPIHDLLNQNINIHGMAHITGGGIWDNIPRVLPKNLGVDIQRGSWQVPPIFNLLINLGKLDEQTAYHTFNMGIGFVIMMQQESWNKTQDILSKHKTISAQCIGHVVDHHQSVRLCN